MNAVNEQCTKRWMRTSRFSVYQNWLPIMTDSRRHMHAWMYVCMHVRTACRRKERRGYWHSWHYDTHDVRDVSWRVAMQEIDFHFSHFRYVNNRRKRCVIILSRTCCMDGPNTIDGPLSVQQTWLMGRSRLRSYVRLYERSYMDRPSASDSECNISMRGNNGVGTNWLTDGPLHRSIDRLLDRMISFPHSVLLFQQRTLRTYTQQAECEREEDKGKKSEWVSV